MPVNAKLGTAGAVVRLLMIQVPLILFGLLALGSVTPLIVMAAPFTSPAVLVV
jgi:hypothetical protein